MPDTEVEIAAESFEEENGNFNEFGAPDPSGVPIAEIFAEPIVVVPNVATAAEAEKWTDVPILPSTEELSGRRGDKKESMIPNFLGRTSGHQNIPSYAIRRPTPMTFFLLYMNHDIVTRLVESTNEYAGMVQCRTWKMLDETEFLYFITIIVFMGIIKLPERPMYWRKDSYGQDFPKKIMSAGRFEQILSHWHWIAIPD